MTFQEFMKEKALSKREIEVALEVTKGLTNKEIASNLFVTEKTVKFHLTSVYKKLSLKSRSSLIVLSARQGKEQPNQTPAAVEPAVVQSPGSVVTRLYPGAGNA